MPLLFYNVTISSEIGCSCEFYLQKSGHPETDLQRREEAFNGIEINREHCDKLTGAKADQPQLNKQGLEAKGGDNICVESISHLGRNKDDLRQIVQECKDKDITVHFIKEGFTKLLYQGTRGGLNNIKSMKSTRVQQYGLIKGVAPR